VPFIEDLIIYIDIYLLLRSNNCHLRWHNLVLFGSFGFN